MASTASKGRNESRRHVVSDLRDGLREDALTCYNRRIPNRILHARDAALSWPTDIHLA